MKSNNETLLIELESKIRILEIENQTLSAKAEENLLLNRAFEEIDGFDNDSLLINTLEGMSILLDISFAGIFELIDKRLICVSSYAQFSNEDSGLIKLSVADKIIDKLNSKAL